MATSKPTKDSVKVEAQTPERDEVRGPVLGEQQDYQEGVNPSDKGVSGTYPQGDDKLVTKADGQVWPADNRDAFKAQDPADAQAADQAAREHRGADSPDLIPPAAGQVTNSTVPGTATDPESAPTVKDLQATRVENS